MSKYIIQGGNPLKGNVDIKGAKNSAMPIITACCLVNDETILRNIPTKNDPLKLLKMLEGIGVKVSRIDEHSWKLDASSNLESDVNGKKENSIRGSQTMLGAMLARNGKVTLKSLGGCNIGSRPMDIHLKGFEALGAKVITTDGRIELEAKNGLIGTNFHLPFPSVGATENLMIAACKASGDSTLTNCAKEPEITDLADFLNSCGAKISGAGTDTIKITGVSELHGTDYSIISDRIEAGTYMIAAAISNGDVKVSPINPAFVDALIIKLQEAGISVETNDTEIRVQGSGKIKPLNIKTLPFPGFPTDLQPQITSLLSLADGTSVITETIFENRFAAVPELNKMDANITQDGKTIQINGVPKLTGATVKALDLRGGASLVLAALAADGKTIVEDVEHIERGYDGFHEKLLSLGADIQRIE